MAPRARYFRQARFIEAAAKKNPAVKKMFLDGPKAARATWKKDADKSKALTNTVLALEDQLSDTPVACRAARRSSTKTSATGSNRR